MKIITRIMAVILTLCMIASLVPMSVMTASASGIGSDSFKDWGAWELYSKGFNVSGNIIEALGKATGNGDVAEVTTFINNTFFGGDTTDDQLAALQKTCDEILDTVTKMSEQLNAIYKKDARDTISESAKDCHDAWQSQVMDVIKAGNGKDSVYQVYSKYRDYLSHASSVNTQNVEQYEIAYISALRDCYANCASDNYDNKKILDSPEYYDYKMYTSDAIDSVLRTRILDLLVNMDPTKDTLEAGSNLGQRYIDLVAQYAYYNYRYSSEQAEFVDMSAEAQINVVTTLIMIYQDFLARRAEYYNNLNYYFNMFYEIDEVTNEINEKEVDKDKLSKEDEKVYKRWREIVDGCNNCSTKKIEKEKIEIALGYIADNYSSKQKCNHEFSQYYDKDSDTSDYIGLLGTFEDTIDKFINGDIKLATVGATTKLDKYVRDDSVSMPDSKSTSTFNLQNSKYKSSYSVKYKNGHLIKGNKKHTCNANFTEKCMSFYKNAAVNVKNGELVFTPFYVLNGNVLGNNTKLTNFKKDYGEVYHYSYGGGTSIGYAYFTSCDYINLKEGIYTDGINSYKPVPNIDQVKSLVNPTAYTARYGQKLDKYFSGWLNYGSSDKDNMYLILNGKVRYENNQQYDTFNSYPFLNMKDVKSIDGKWSESRLGESSNSGTKKYKDNDRFALFLVPENSKNEIRSKVDVKVVGEGGSVEITDYTTTDDKTVNTYDESKGTAIAGEDVKISVKAPEKYDISSVKVQYHNDVNDIKKVTGEKVIFEDIETNDFTFNYPVPYSNVTIVVETRTFKTDKNGNFVIESYNDLSLMSDLVNGQKKEYVEGSYILANDIVANENLFDENGELKDSDLNVWTPIGTSSAPFKGSFDGKGHTISGLYIDDTNIDYAGLFGYNGSTIQNIGLVDSYIKGNYQVGGIVGYNEGTVENCYNTGTVSGTNYYIGGIVGYNNGTVENCYNTGTVSGVNNIGGIIGCNSGVMVENCYNTGTVSGVDNIGGIIGQNGDMVENCYNAGTVSGADNIGGIIGQNGGIVENCYNTGTVSDGTYIGGIVGYNANTVKNCYNIGTVSDGAYIGGIIGQNDGIVENCYNTGTVSDGAYIGGIVGYNANTVKNCYNIGTVSDGAYIGGIVGYNANTVKNCYFLENYTFDIGIGGGFDGEAFVKTIEQFASGDVAYSLNKEVTDGTPAWYQNLDNGNTPDDYPVLVNNDKNTVYRVDRKDRTYSNLLAVPIKLDTKINEGTIELSNNNPMSGGSVDITINAPEGYYIEKVVAKYYADGSEETISGQIFNNSCTLSHKFYGDATIEVVTKRVLDVDEDGNFIIRTYDDLCNMAKMVNSGKDEYVKGSYIVENDIDCSGKSWTPIGQTALYYMANPTTDGWGFKGTFDGNGNVIKNLSFTGSSEEDLSYGIFGTLSGTVKNLGVENFTYTGAGKDSRVGAIAGQILDGGVITNCYVNNSDINTQVNTKNGVAGGIAGANYSGTIDNCYTYDVNIVAGRVGGIVGDNYGDANKANGTDRPGTIKNCVTTSSSICKRGSATDSLSNVSINTFKSGEVAYFLNKEVTDGTQAWYQNIGGENADAYPVLDSTHNTVYKSNDTYTNGDLIGDINCDGAIDKADSLLLDEYLEREAVLTLEEVTAGDVNGDGKTDSNDLDILKAYINQEDTDYGNVGKYRINNMPIDALLVGDVNFDGAIDQSDADLLAQFHVEMIDLTDEQKKAGDIDLDGHISAKDISEINKYVAIVSNGKTYTGNIGKYSYKGINIF